MVTARMTVKQLAVTTLAQKTLTVRWAAGLIAVGAAFGPLCDSASAHAVGLSRGEYHATERGLSAVWTFAASEVGATLVGPQLHDWAVVRAAGQPCAGHVVDVTRLEADGVAVQLEYECDAPGSDAEGARRGAAAAHLDVDLAPMFARLSHGHRHHVTNGAEPSRVLAGTNPRIQVLRALPQATPPRDSPRAPTWCFIGLGFEHILLGFDHLLLLLMLVVVPLSWRRLLSVVTTFTCAHSAALAWAVLCAWTPPSQWVEPAIAATLMLLGLENLRLSASLPRLGVSFGFGLVHGLGFAGALLDLGLSGTSSFGPLLQFNLGVELGQLLVLAGLLPVIRLAKRWRGERWLIQAASLGVCVVGAVWLVERLNS